MEIFTALADPVRRDILALLRQGEQAAGTLVETLDLPQPNVSKHLKALREAGLVSIRIDGPRRLYSLDPGPLAQLDAWLAPYREFWAATDRLGVIERAGDHIDVRFERLYRRPVESVWRALTEPARLSDWMGESFVEPFVGGRYETMLDGLKPMRGRVRIWEPPTLLEYDFRNDHAPQSVARWELSPVESGTRVTFRHSGMPYLNANLMMPGWHVYLSHLGGSLEGAKPEEFTTAWRQMQDIYARHHGLGELTREP